MRYILCSLIILIGLAAESQNKIIWKATPKKLPELRQESYLKLEFQLDTFTVLDVLNEMPPEKYWNIDTLLKSNVSYFKDKPAILKEQYKVRFEEGFNSSLEEKLEAKYSLSENAYRYSFSIKPMRYYIYTHKSVPDEAGRASYKYYYLVGDYSLDVFRKDGGQPLCHIILYNLFNEKPMCAPYAKEGRYSNDPSVEINKNMYLAGKEAGKRFLKLSGK